MYTAGAVWGGLLTFFSGVDFLDIIDFVVLGVGGFLIGLMRAGFGGGIGVVAVPVLALVVPAKSALGLVLPLSLATDVISARYYWGHWVGDHVKAADARHGAGYFDWRGYFG